MENTVIPQAERRKQVRLRMRGDLIRTAQRYEGRQCTVVKDPVSLKYYRFNEQEYFVFQLLDGKHTLEDVQKKFEEYFRPHRLTLEDLEGFARQLVTSGLVQHESALAGKHLFDRRRKQRRMKQFATFSNILYIKVPIFDPDRILNWMYKYLFWMFSTWFLLLSVGVMIAAGLLVLMKFQIFYDRLPAYHEFFQFRTMLYMWIALGIVKVIHEFGHGLSCKAFGGECHEMGALFMCFSPALYCNVTDSWTVADKWKRIIISFAGIYVELIIAALATFVWWNTPHWPFINNVSLCLMVLCSVSTFVFNANPLMRFDGYYILADWLEVPNLRERANRYLTNLASEKCLGIEVPPEQYMAPWRRVLFVTYAVTSYIYRWVLTFSIVYFLWDWLKPYKLETLSAMLAIGAVGSMIFWPVYRMYKNISQRGRLPDMKRKRVLITLTILAGLIVAFFTVPIPFSSRVRETGLVQIQENAREYIFLPDEGILQVLHVRDGDQVTKNQVLAEFYNPKFDVEYTQTESALKQAEGELNAMSSMMTNQQMETSTKMEMGQKKSRLREDIAGYKRDLDRIQRRRMALKEIKAPRDGHVMSTPRKEDINRMWDKSEHPFCTIGDPKKLRILLPVTPPDYLLLAENLQKRGELEVSIHLPGRSDRDFTGRITKLPETNASEVPIALTHRGGGSLAVKPNPSNPNIQEPLVQTYLIPIEILDNDHSFVPGTLVSVKIHNEWRSAAWWVWRNLASAFDFGLI